MALFPSSSSARQSAGEAQTGERVSVQAGQASTWQSRATSRSVSGCDSGVNQSAGGGDLSASSEVLAPQTTAAEGSIDLDTFMLYRGRALRNNFSNVSFTGLSNLKSEDRELLVQVSKQVDNPIRIRTMDWTNILTSKLVRKQFCNKLM